MRTPFPSVLLFSFPFPSFTFSLSFLSFLLLLFFPLPFPLLSFSLAHTTSFLLPHSHTLPHTFFPRPFWYYSSFPYLIFTSLTIISPPRIIVVSSFPYPYYLCQPTNSALFVFHFLFLLRPLLSSLSLLLSLTLSLFFFSSRPTISCHHYRYFCPIYTLPIFTPF